MSPTPATVDKPRDPLAALRIPRNPPPRRGGAGRWLRRIVVLLILVALAGAGAYAIKREELASLWSSLQPRPEVRVGMVTTASGRSGDALVVATGYVESRQQAKIGARATGRVQDLFVEEGTFVKAGHVLAVLEHADLEAALAAAKATLRQMQAQAAEHEVEIARTKKRFEREERLNQAAASTPMTYDDAKFAYESAIARRESLAAAVELAQARVREAEQMTENMRIRAPFDGTIISKDAELGESILPGGMGEASGRGSVATIADLAHLEVECDVKEDYIGRVALEQECEVAVDAVPGRRYAGRVRKIIPMGDRARATIKVKVAITDADEQLFPEMSATVYFLPDEEAAVEVPERRVYCPDDALVDGTDAVSVWVVDAEGRLRKVSVKVGARDSGRAEILDGLSGGERVVLKPAAELRAEQLVRVVD